MTCRRRDKERTCTRKYVRKHDAPKKIIGDKEYGNMTRKRLESETFLLCEVEPKSIKDALENEDWIQAMNEKIEKIN